MSLALAEIFDMSYKPHVYFACWNETRWIVVSSTFFLVPAWYSYINRLYWLSCVLTSTSVISANYWKRANYSWERLLDRVFAKLCFIIFVVNGVVHLKGSTDCILGYSGLVLLVYCYFMSCHSSNPNWWKYHMTFHFITACSQILIIKNMSIER